jgi:hypothetical protein
MAGSMGMAITKGATSLTAETISIGMAPDHASTGEKKD